MSANTTISDLAQLVKRGDLDEAKRQASTMLGTANPHDLHVVANCAHILDTWPRIGVVKLRAYWRSSNEHDRAIIATCALERGEQRSQPDPTTNRAPHWTRRNKHQAPRDVRREVRPDRRRTPRPNSEEPATVTAYHRERAGVDDAPQHGERPDGYAIDYDRAALPPLSGTPCVRCWLERSAADQNRAHDDGLCTECRDRGLSGVPALPEGHSQADAVAARCAFIAAAHPQLAVRLLRRYWQSATRDRDTIAAWVAHRNGTTPTDDAAPTPSPADTAELAACASCGEPRYGRDVRHVDTDDGLCASCRAVDDEGEHAPAA